MYRIEKRSNDEPAKNIERESIILMLIKTIFERAIQEMELAVINTYHFVSVFAY